MIGQRPPPTFSKYQRQGSGFHGSPVEPRTRSDERSCALTPLVARAPSARGSRSARCQHGDAVALDHAPRGGRARDSRACPRRARAVAPSISAAADRPRPHHPAEVGDQKRTSSALHVEAVGHVLRGLDREAAVDVDRALRPAGGAGGVDDHVGVVRRRSRRSRTRQAGPGTTSCHQTSRPAVQGTSRRCAARRGRCARRRRPPPRRRPPSWGPCHGAEPRRGDEQVCVAIAQSGGERLGPEPGEDRRVDGADLPAGENRSSRQHPHKCRRSSRSTRAGAGTRQAVRLQLQLAEGEPAPSRRRRAVRSPGSVPGGRW